MTRLVAVAVAAGVLATGPTGCSKRAAAPQTTVQGAEMKFVPDHLALESGRHRFRFTNVGTVTHELAIVHGTKVFTRSSAAPGQSVDLETITLPAGIYQMRCDEPGHVAAGMVGPIVVR